MSDEEVDGPENSHEISQFIHCGLCGREFMLGLAPPECKSPAEYADIEVGWTKRGFQVWCNRHSCNVLHVDFEGQQHRARTDARLTPSLRELVKDLERLEALQ